MLDTNGLGEQGLMLWRRPPMQDSDLQKLKKALSYMARRWHGSRMMRANASSFTQSDSAWTSVRRILPLTGAYLCYLIVALSLIVQPARAQDKALHVPATLVAETTAPKPGEAVMLAFEMRPQPGWHGYWENPGDAGYGMRLQWTLPDGVTAGAPQYPVPETLIISGLMNHVYEHDYAVLMPMEISAAIKPGTRLPIKVKADWLSCTDKVCVPEGDTLSIELVAGDGAKTAEAARRFDAWRAALPARLDQQARYQIKGKVIEIAIPFPANAAADKPWFFARTENLFRYAAPQSVRRTGNWLVVSGEVTHGFEGPITGVLRFDDGQGIDILAKRRDVPQGGVAVPSSGEPTMADKMGPFALLVTLGAAILGGILLNLMPCVFPILGLKALALAKAGGDERQARTDALAYSAGVILSCVALGALMLALRAAGEQVGWAFQLQEPRVVLPLLVLMVAITANLAGLFELPALSLGGAPGKDGMAGSFWTGVLAAVVATPCTGPFMAAALGAALLLPPLPALLLFAGLGFGIALPFLAIAFIPQLRGLLPRSGAWLDRFRKWMAVPMGLTALGLLWVLSRLSGSTGLLLGIGASVVLLALMFWIGRRQRMGLTGAGALAIAGLAIAASFTLLLPREPVQTLADVNLLESQPFSDAQLAQLRREGKPVFVYFTADWCLTCKVNEQAAINREDTARHFRAKGIVTLKGDFTRSDPDIARFLTQQGRSGVPLYLYYAPSAAEPEVLPQILTPTMMAKLGS